MTTDRRAMGIRPWFTTIDELPGAHDGMRARTDYGRTWDGRFTARCPHGVVVTWNAFGFAKGPSCTCEEGKWTGE